MATEAQALPEKIRQTFEEFGVIKRIAVPKLDLLDKAIKDRKGRWEIQTGADGIAVASVMMHGQKFDGAADESNLALSVAFASAMIGTQARQGQLFRQQLHDDIELDDDVTPMASAAVNDSEPESFVCWKCGGPLASSHAICDCLRHIHEAKPEIVVEQTLRAAGIPVRYDADSGLYRNPLGDAYPERWAEQEAGIQSRRIGFVGSRS